jgi:alkanesulfonate monooxygenase SsuD/methylene tetrahydromethanopterin reductase-like flavin-dependent oxidoreductase (luciferase family)
MPEGDTLRQAFAQLAQGGRFIVGGPETCTRQIREHVERLGATAFLFRFQWPGMPQELVLASMRRAAEAIFPLLR